MVEPQPTARFLAESRRTADSRDVCLLEPISPELALVDPCLAAAARAALPDEPWNHALEQARSREVAVPLATPVRSTGTAFAPTQVPERPRVGAAAVRRLALVAAWAVLITGFALLAEVRSPGGPAVVAEASTSGRAQEVLPTPVPGGGYVIDGRSSFRVGPQGRAIGAMTLPVRCLWGVRLPRIPVAGDKSFAYRGTLRGTRMQPVSIRLEGKFEGPRHARGTIAVKGRGCRTVTVSFRARLS